MNILQGGARRRREDWRRRSRGLDATVTGRLAAEVRGSRCDSDWEGTAVPRGTLQGERSRPWSSHTLSHGDERSGGGGLEPPSREALSRVDPRVDRVMNPLPLFYSGSTRFDPLGISRSGAASEVGQTESFAGLSSWQIAWSAM